jgi:hypothetical protein
MNVILEAYLCEPPSSIHCFRDVTLYVSCFVQKHVLVECEKHEKDSYYRWLKSYGAYDFVDDIISVEKEFGYRVGRNKANLKVERITEHNLNYVISNLRILNQ